MDTLREREEFDRLLASSLAIVFKHSRFCGISVQARKEVARFLASHPEHRVYEIDVHRSRPVSSYVERVTGVRHESPQLIVLARGRVVWHDSHGGVTADALGSKVAEAASANV